MRRTTNRQLTKQQRVTKIQSPVHVDDQADLVNYYFYLSLYCFCIAESKHLLLLNAYVVYSFSASRTPDASSGRNTCDGEVDDVDQSESNVSAEQSGGHAKTDKPAPRRSARLSKAGMKNSCNCKFFM